MLSLIAAIGKNRELGKGNKLLFRISDDMRFFKEITLGHKVLMGRKTWESLPGKLSDRRNIVISKNDVPGADEVIHDLPSFIREYQNSSEEIFVIGGGMVYFETLRYAKNVYLTEVDAEDREADAFFPDFDRSQYEKMMIEEGVDGGLKYTISKYQKKEEK